MGRTSNTSLVELDRTAMLVAEQLAATCWLGDFSSRKRWIRHSCERLDADRLRTIDLD